MPTVLQKLQGALAVLRQRLRGGDDPNAARIRRRQALSRRLWKGLPLIRFVNLPPILDTSYELLNSWVAGQTRTVPCWIPMDARNTLLAIRTTDIHRRERSTTRTGALLFFDILLPLYSF